MTSIPDLLLVTPPSRLQVYQGLSTGLAAAAAYFLGR